MATIGITGGTGLVGRQVGRLLTDKGHHVIIFSRNPVQSHPNANLSYAILDAASKKCDRVAIGALDAVIHLAGEPVAAKRWTKAQRQRIVDSRVTGTRFLIAMLGEHGKKCDTFIGASAIGIYGSDRPQGRAFTEDSPSARDFLATTCVQWEAAEQEIAAHMRTVILRIGIVFAREGGALPAFTRMAPYRILPVTGNGKQVMSWIHIGDLARLIVHSLEDRNMSGIYNAVAPEPTTCTGLIATIAAEKGGIFLRPHVPAAMLYALFGTMASEVLKSATVSAEKLKTTGFTFRFPAIKEAIHDLLG